MKEGWKTTTLGDVSSIYNGNSINADYKRKHFFGQKEGYPFIATKDVSFNGNIDYENGVKIPFNTDYKIAEPHSVFICVEGGSAGRKIAYITEKVCFGNKLFCIQPKESRIIGKYAYYFLQSESFQYQFRNLLTGLIGGVSSKKFKSIEISYPNIPEQQRIVEYLDTQFAKIDALKANAAQQLQAAKDLFQSALKDLMTPKAGWEEKTLVDIVEKDCTLSYGIVQPGEGIENGVPVVRPVDITNEVYVYKKNLKKTTEIISNAYKRTILKGDEILLCVRGTTGTIALASLELANCNVTRGIVPIRLKKDISKVFIYYHLLSPKTQTDFAKITTGATLKQINIKSLRELKISIPNKEIQNNIASVLENVMCKIKALQSNYEQTITLCSDLKQSLLKQIFE